MPLMRSCGTILPLGDFCRLSTFEVVGLRLGKTSQLQSATIFCVAVCTCVADTKTAQIENQLNPFCVLTYEPFRITPDSNDILAVV